MPGVAVVAVVAVIAAVAAIATVSVSAAVSDSILYSATVLQVHLERNRLRTMMQIITFERGCFIHSLLKLFMQLDLKISCWRDQRFFEREESQERGGIAFQEIASLLNLLALIMKLYCSGLCKPGLWVLRLPLYLK